MLNQGKQPSKGMNRQGLRFMGILCLLAGIVGQSILMNRLLGMKEVPSGQLVTQLSAALENPDNMAIATIALLTMFIQACAIPIFSFLLVEGFRHTSSVKMYFLRVAGVALLSEIPYNLAISGTWLDLSTRNPVFGMVLCLAVLYLYQHYEGKSIKNILIKVLVFFLALVWAHMLGIVDGAAAVIVVVAVWLLRNKPNFLVLGGCVAMFVASMFSLFYLLAPLTFLAIHYYNEEPGEGNKAVNYLAYPVMLLVIGLVAMFAF